MARQSIKLYATKSVIIRQDNPTSRVVVDKNAKYNLIQPVEGASDAIVMLLGFSAFPAALRKQRLYDIKGKACVYWGALQLKPLQTTFNAQSVTWETRPEVVIKSDGRDIYDIAAGKMTGDPDDPEDLTLSYGLVNDYIKSENASAFLKAMAAQATSSNRTYALMVREMLVAGTEPYIEIFYDDSVTVTSIIKATSYPTGQQASNQAMTFRWDFVYDGNYTCAADNWTQKSATFFWKTSGETSYHAVPASGSNKSITIPANTFPTGSTIQWYVSGTDSDDTTSQTSILSFTTLPITVTLTTYPTGNNVDVRSVHTFAWTVANSSQKSAILFWKKSTESVWNQIPVNGSTTRIDTTPYTFPSGAQIQWYLEVTDATDGVYTIDQASFTTAAAKVTPDGFPSGSNIDTRNAITFSWTITGTLGEYNQKSARFFWRPSTAIQWNTISINTSEKGVSVPANTFPTSSTIQWYVEATDASGTTTSAAQKTFNTVATKITAQSYPSGNDVDFGRALAFSWIFKNNAGSDYPQRSASLFWRSSTEDAWTEIPAEGTAQHLTVPAFTFPSNATVTWYLRGVDIGGGVSTTSEQNFKTVAPQITPQSSPTSGYADPRNAITFAWFFSTGGNNYPQQSADFYWRVAGQEAWNHVAAEGTTQSVTIPADTFPRLSSIEWYLTGTDIGGTYSETEVYTFSTVASTAHAICMAPVGQAVDGSKPVTLRWIVQNDDGSAATRTILRWKLPSESQSEWHGILDTTEEITEYTVPEGTFPPGPIEWLAIAYNRDDVAGPASQASFVCVAAPDAPTGLTATAVPLTEIRWQATGQEAYEISIDGSPVAESFGADVYSYRVREPLADGVHTIAVRIQGSYGLWSKAAETQIFVSNAPKGEISLVGNSGTDAELFWEYSGEDDPETVAIYRDGKWIGTATGADSFADRYVLGAHEYRVEYWFADGNYTRSETVSALLSCSTMMIAALDGGPWLSLRLSENENRTLSFTKRRQSAQSHITARKYPILELSTFEELIGEFDCAFRSPEEAEAFENLFGRVVILKTRDGTVITGGLTETVRKVTRYYSAYTFTLEQKDVEDFVSHDAND